MNRTQFSVRAAAEQVGVSRQTMFRHIKDGKVSATTDKAGQKQIELTELLRAFGELHTPGTRPATVTDNLRVSRTTNATQRDNPLLQIELVRLQAQLETKAAELEMARERINELKAREHSTGEEKNRLLEIIERQTLLLAAPPPILKPVQRQAPKKTPAKPVTQPVKRTSKAMPVKLSKKAAVTAPKKKVPLAQTKTAAKKTIRTDAPAKTSTKPAAVKRRT